MAVGLALKAVRILSAWQSLGFELDVIEVARWALRAQRAASSLQGHASGINERALNEMVDLAQSRVAVRTGRLKIGVTGIREGEMFVFSAYARRDGAEDYAPFVERGTRPGVRGRVYSRPAAGSSDTRQTRARRTHPGTEAQPFFYVSAREVLERYRQEHTAAYALAAAQTVE